jgi:NAD-dependent deacetylase
MRHAKANPGHLAFVHLHEQNKLLGMITQNIEGLHQESGLSQDLVIELHGTTRVVTCLTCHDSIGMDEACERVRNGEPAPKCQKNNCGGYLKPATVSFGQALPVEALQKASQLCEACEVFIAVGSSLVVHPAAGFPVLAKQAKAKLIIINREETPLDGIADAVFHEEISDILPELVGL